MQQKSTSTGPLLDARESSAEFLYMLEGSIAIRFEQEDHVLRAGDSVYFDATEPHSYRGLGKTGGSAIVVTTEPRE